MRILLNTLFLSAAIGVSSLASANSMILELQDATELAVKGNPGLAVMNARYDAMSAMPDQVGTLPDPIIMFGLMNYPTDSFDRGQEAMTQNQIGFSQSFPFPGKLSLKEEAAQFAADAAQSSVEEMRLKLVNNVSIKWWQIFYLDKAVNTVETNQELLRQFINVAKTKYQTGKGLQQDVLLSQLELSKLIDKKLQLVAMRDSQAVQLNILMNRDPSFAIRLPDNVPLQLRTLIPESELYEMAAKFSPRLKKMEAKVSEADSKLALAKKGFYPDFNVGLTYGDREGDNPPFLGGERSNFLSLRVGIKVPLYAGTKQSKAVSQRSSEYEKQRYALLDELNQVKAEISSTVIAYGRAQEQLGLFKDGIIPQSRQTVDSMLAGYQVDQVDFLNLIRSQMTLINYELLYWKAFTEAKQALSRLDMVVGKESVYE